MFTKSPEGLGLSPASPTLQGWNSNLQPAGQLPELLPPTPLPRRKRKGQPWSHPGISGGGMPLSTPPPPPLRPHIFTFGCFFFPFFLCQENQALAPAADLPPTLN